VAPCQGYIKKSCRSPGFDDKPRATGRLPLLLANDLKQVSRRGYIYQ